MVRGALEIAELGTFKIDIETNIAIYTENVRKWFGQESLSQPDSGPGKVQGLKSFYLWMIRVDRILKRTILLKCII
jgi:hypothetical protein